MKYRLISCIGILTLIAGMMSGCGQKQDEAGGTGTQTESGAASGTEVSEDVSIQILYTNDVHCAVDADEENGILGYAKIAALKKQLEGEGYAVALVDNGDAIQGDAIGTLSDGAYLVSIMNAAGYDVAIPGNHEFDYGMERFVELTGAAEYEYVSCNLTDVRTGQLLLDPYTVLDMGGKKVAFVGVTTPKTLISSSPAAFWDEDGNYIYSFLQDEDGTALYDAVQSSVDAAREEGADYVIVMAHLGTEAVYSPWMSTELIANTTGIDAVLDGHSHSTIEEEFVSDKDGRKVLLTSTGSKFAAVGQLTIGEDGGLHSQLITEYDKTDEATAQVIQELEQEFDEKLNEVVGTTDFALYINEPSSMEQEEKVRLIRNAETNLGDLCADAYRYVTGADIAVINGGGIRDDILAGDITYGDILSVHPYGNEICMKKVTGQQILDALEMGARMVPEENGGFLQVSGLSYEIHMDVASSVEMDENGMFQGVSGEYRVQNVMVGDEPLDVNAEYTLASHGYLLKEGGDGMNMFVEDELLMDSIILDNRAIIDYISVQMGGTVGSEYENPYGQERIIAIE